MKIDIYKSIKDGTKYLSVLAGTDIEKKPFPSDLDPDLLSLSPFKTSLDIQPDESRVALNSNEVIKQINDKGFAVHTATISVTVTTSPRS